MPSPALHARGIPNSPRRRAMTARGAVVLDVIVDQREVVQQLQPSRGGNARRVAAGRGAGQQTQKRPDALAGGRLSRLKVRVEPAHVILHDGVVARAPQVPGVAA